MTTSNDRTSTGSFLTRISIPLVLAGMILFCGSARLAADEAAKKAAPKAGNIRAAAKAPKPANVKAAQAVPAKTKKVVVTGTRIPREPKGPTHTYIVGSPVHVIERSEIERCGAMTTAGVLRRLPFVR